MILILNNGNENADQYPDIVVRLNGKPFQSVKTCKYFGNKIK